MQSIFLSFSFFARINLRNILVYREVEVAYEI